MKELAKYLLDASRLGKRILVLCHRDADPDAVGSTFALAEALKQLGARTSMGSSECVSKVSQALLDALGVEIPLDPSIEADLVVLLDTSSFEHLGKLGERLKQSRVELVVLDHHKPVEEMKHYAKFHVVKEDYTSEAELVLELIERLGAKLTPQMAFGLLAGIISDTGLFRFARNATFEAVYKLLQAGADYEQVLKALRLPDDPSKRIAMLKAAQRVELHRVNEALVVISEVGSFEADAAAALVRIGADVAFVGSEEKGEVRVCARAREDLLEKTKLHLGEFMAELAKEFKGSGGGHAGAASMTGSGGLEAVKNAILKRLRQQLVPER